MNEVYAVYHDLVTGYGHGSEACMNGLLSGRNVFRSIDRFSVCSGYPEQAGLFPDGITPDETVFSLLAKKMPHVADTPPVYFALTVGNIEVLYNPENRWTSELMMEKVLSLLHLKNGRIISGACASGNLAIYRAFQAISSGKNDMIIVAGCDFVSEFVYSGFFSVNAMSPDCRCRPYDARHNGLLLGDAAGIILLASAEAVRKNHWTPLCRIKGCGSAVDACHIAAPDPSGKWMAHAIRKAMGSTLPDEVGSVIGHGTGTQFNDDMELAAAAQIFPAGVPLVSIKGGTGHLLAASGLAQFSVGIEMLNRKQIFPQTGFEIPAAGAERYVSSEIRPLQHLSVLSLNAGFGGVNAAVLMEAV